MKYSSQKKMERFDQFMMLKNDFENQNLILGLLGMYFDAAVLLVTKS